MPRTSTDLFFFLGGHDLEMVTIRELLEKHAPHQFQDDGLAWGAKVSDYRERIGKELTAGHRIVLVELLDDLNLQNGPFSARVISVDHHGELAGKERPTSLEQVFDLLELPQSAWTRWHDLVVANDRGHARAMLACSATPEELQVIRAADRRAQGVTVEQEAAGRAAAARAELLCGGDLTMVRLSHGRTATVTDVLDAALGGSGYRNLLVLCPNGPAFFGDGRVVQSLQHNFPGGYYGGQLPDRGFWGHPERQPENELLQVIRHGLETVSGKVVPA